MLLVSPILLKTNFKHFNTLRFEKLFTSVKKEKKLYILISVSFISISFFIGHSHSTFFDI